MDRRTVLKFMASGACASALGAPALAKTVEVTLSSTAANFAEAITASAKLTASDASDGAGFGGTVAMSSSGRTIVIGTSAHKAYVFEWDGAAWIEEEIFSGIGAVAVALEVAVSADGQTIAVGDRATGSGEVLLYTRSASGWAHEQVLGPSRSASEGFGFKVALSDDGDTVVVGAYRDSTKGSNAGAAYVYYRSGGTWSEQGYLVASNGAAGDGFGRAVAVSGDGMTCLIGAPYVDDPYTRTGRCYAFAWDGTAWAEQQILAIAGPYIYDDFGFALSLSQDGRTAAVAAYNKRVTRPAQGAVFIFARAGMAWSEQTMLISDAPNEYDYFGYSVSISADGTKVAIGSMNDDTAVQDAGACLVFGESGGTWTLANKLTAPDAGAGDAAGHAVALSGNGATVAFGAYAHDNGGTNRGTVYVSPV